MSPMTERKRRKEMSSTYGALARTVHYLPSPRPCCLPVIGDISISALTGFGELQEVLLRVRTYLHDCSCLDE